MFFKNSLKTFMCNLACIGRIRPFEVILVEPVFLSDYMANLNKQNTKRNSQLLEYDMCRVEVAWVRR